MTVNSAILKSIRSGLPLDDHPWRQAHGEAEWPEAAVLVTLSDEDDPQVLLGRRALHLPSHPGEVAFPGGKREPEDATPWVTARREAFEEVGIPAELVRPLGEQDSLLTRTGFEVYPCIAAIPTELDLVVDEGEFDSVFRAPLRTFADQELFCLEEMSHGDNVYKVPHYQVGQDNIWGVTAAILARLANLAYDAGLDLQRNWKVRP